MSPRLAFALDAATHAGRLTLGHFQGLGEVYTKADDTPVTDADRAAERLLRTLIGAAYPGEAILGEEEGGDHSTSERWIIDPIDGTKSFVAGVPLYATLLSFEVEQTPILGVCYFPALKELLYAEAGEGAFFNGRRARVSRKTCVAGAILSCGGHKTMAARGRALGFERLSERALATRTWSDAYGHALVATGRIEAMVDPLVSLWDVSALSLIVEEAGGTFSRFDGSPVAPGPEPYEAVSSNGKLHAEVLEAFRQ